ncbi:MAG TPA: hypothetical protein VE130_16295 [Nitrososphaeraceae archaeon]|nr:hypothetical protein [Nitrososphaeraceae archaeon]
MTYLDILQDLGASTSIKYPWIFVNATSRIQGWKLHLSIINKEVKKLLNTVVPVLCENQIPFKLAQDEIVLALLNEGRLGATQVGKFITIYPENDKESFKIARKLIRLTKGFHGPIIVTDIRLGDITYTRFGSFNPIIKHDRLGQQIRYIYGSNRKLIQDRYSIPLT